MSPRKNIIGMSIKSTPAKNHQGQSAVEFLLVFLIFFFTIIGLVDFSQAWWTLNSLNMGVREGARFASVTPDLVPNDQRVIDRVKETLKSSVNPANLSVEVNFDTSPPVAGDAIRVLVKLPYNFLSHTFVPTLSSVTLKSRAAMSYEVK